MYLYDNPVVSASQATTELLPPESDIDGRGRTEFQQLLTSLMYIQRETVKMLRSSMAAVSRAQPEERPAMLAALNAVTDELAERLI